MFGLTYLCLSTSVTTCDCLGELMELIYDVQISCFLAYFYKHFRIANENNLLLKRKPFDFILSFVIEMSQMTYT